MSYDMMCHRPNDTEERLLYYLSTAVSLYSALGARHQYWCRHHIHILKHTYLNTHTLTETETESETVRDNSGHGGDEHML